MKITKKFIKAHTRRVAVPATTEYTLVLTHEEAVALRTDLGYLQHVAVEVTLEPQTKAILEALRDAIGRREA